MCSGQAGSQRSTPTLQASQGSKCRGQRSASQSVRNGTGTGRPALAARARSSAVALLGSRSVLLIAPAIRQLDVGAIRRLARINADVGGGLGELDAVHARLMQGGVNARQRHIQAEAVAGL